MPAASSAVSSTATPFLSGHALPRLAVPSEKVTQPTGTGPLEAVVACKWIVWLVSACAGVAVSEVVVA